MQQVRAATLSDIWSIARTRRRQRVLYLNPPYTLVQPDPMMHDMVRSQMPVKQPTSMLFVYVERGAVLGYVQVRCRWRRRDEWAITMMGTTERAPEQVWDSLVEEVCREAGEAGAIRIFTKISEDEPTQELFLRFGFTRYTKEAVWGNLLFAQAGGPIDEPERGPLRKLSNRDAWDLMQLYRHVTPPVAQRAEAMSVRQWKSGPIRPRLFGQGLVENTYVWADKSQGELSGSTSLGGFVRLLTGPRGHWITMLFRTDFENRDTCGHALDYALWKATRLGTKPVYCAVREYQAEIESLLEERGFHMLTQQSLLVKYIAEPVREAQPALVPFLVPNKGELVVTDFSAWPNTTPNA